MIELAAGAPGTGVDAGRHVSRPPALPDCIHGIQHDWCSICLGHKRPRRGDDGPVLLGRWDTNVSRRVVL